MWHWDFFWKALDLHVSESFQSSSMWKGKQKHRAQNEATEFLLVLVALRKFSSFRGWSNFFSHLCSVASFFLGKVLIELYSLAKRVTFSVRNSRCSMKSTAFLTIIMTTNWIFEIISFYNETSSTLFDIINALQGVLIFLIFVCLPRPMKLVGKWWNDRGSFKVLATDDNFANSPNDIQMPSLCKQWVFRKKRGRFE